MKPRASSKAPLNVSPDALNAIRILGALCALGLSIPWVAATPAAGPVDLPAPPDLTVPVLPGETSLIDVGAYRVLWQSYGREVESMPLAWSGHFDTPCGISYKDWGLVSGRRALLMHSPWRSVPPGRTWVEYTLLLPKATPIELSFGIAMGPDVVAPEKSDGVTFSACWSAGEREEELMRRHHDKAEWLDFKFDLSPHAGKTVVLRLQVEPGPRNNPSFDYSYFGDPRITAGASVNLRADLLRRLTSTRSSKAGARAGCITLKSTPEDGVNPSSLLPHENALERSGDVWKFSYEDEDCRLAWTYRPAGGTLEDFTVQVDGGRPFQPARGGEATAIIRKGAESTEVPLRGGRAVSVTQDGGALNVLWEYLAAGKPVRIRWSFRGAGKAIALSARCDDPVIGRFSLGELGPVALRKELRVPYLLGKVAYLPADDLFVCRYLDWTVSHASQCPQGVATYEAKTDGTRNALIESGYVAVSPDIREVLPNIPHPPSPYLAELGPRLMLDIWGHRKGTFASDAECMLALKDHGVDHIAIIQHVWQRFGYDVKLPDHIPADPSFGGDEGMAAFGKAANQCGYLWSVHENYIDLYPDAPSYDPAARVLLADGSPSKAWYNAGTKVQSFGLKCNRALGYAKQNSPEIHRRYATTAAYLDVHTCVPPWHQLDHEAGQPMAAMALAKVKLDSELFQFMRDTHRGPLFGEGANHFYWAGRCDGVEAQVEGGEGHAPFLDFDLLKIHPQMVNHGMGYYERWFRRGYGHAWGRDTGTMEQIDKYRAQTIAYGHAGFISTPQVWNIQWVAREHHLTHPLQRLYGASAPVEILYEVDGRLVTSSVALALAETWRQRIRYESGLTVWVNWREEPWQVEGRLLPRWGVLGLGPQTEVAVQLKEGKHADYAECPEFIFADARTHFDMPYLRARKDIEPRLRSFKHLGAGKAEITYEWIVSDTLGEDYHCFVHGVRPGEGEIEFQGDHALPKPTSQWRKGETIVDGPHEILVPARDDTYELRMGLFKGARVPLEGRRDGEDRILVAVLALERDDGKVTGITAQRPGPERRAGDVEEADFTARLNPPGTWIDFGKVATDGSVKIEREKDRLVVFPYPRDKPVRASLDLKSLAPDADPGRLEVRALAAGTKADLGAVPFQMERGKLVLTCGTPAAGRYVVQAAAPVPKRP